MIDVGVLVNWIVSGVIAAVIGYAVAEVRSRSVERRQVERAHHLQDIDDTKREIAAEVDSLVRLAAGDREAADKIPKGYYVNPHADFTLIGDEAILRELVATNEDLVVAARVHHRLPHELQVRASSVRDRALQAVHNQFLEVRGGRPPKRISRAIADSLTSPEATSARIHQRLEHEFAKAQDEQRIAREVAGTQ